jgi:hypothetical protein
LEVSLPNARHGDGVRTITDTCVVFIRVFPNVFLRLLSEFATRCSGGCPDSLDENPRPKKKSGEDDLEKTLLELDLVGFALFAPVVIMLLLALNWGGKKDAWNSATTIGLICGAFGTLCIFLVWEHRKGDDAMVPFRLFRRRIIVSCYLTGFFQAGALVDMTYYLPLWFQSARRATATMSGVDILPTIGCQILFSAVTAVLGMALH